MQALKGLANALYDMNEPQEAVENYKKALTLDGQQSDVHYNLANALYLLGKTDEAISHYKQAIELNPNKSESFYNLGNAYCVK